MGRGLDSFDAYSWRSLLQAMEILVCAPRHAEALRLADGLEAAGARATIAQDQEIALDRALRRAYAIVVLTLDEGAEPAAPLRRKLAEDGTRLVLLASEERHDALRSAVPEAAVAARRISDRDLVLFLVKTADE
ncbi:hypothetical protein [Aurantimonas sp. 22II-16-19i]|uniref:hypothetical protein n=1 Tax=Aurantimonas sp. 22II-16-19i TaxID=1317114 RepID=UPI0009F7E358|nr:hypothetical protein [Aurantimonas sp. 22II-16-19i]ORE93988.1 hypothetical protein ATO4_14579 [Aurantimonas sp. 22II-16-19i]